jgi:hypothetical protein
MTVNRPSWSEYLQIAKSIFEVDTRVRDNWQGNAGTAKVGICAENCL